MTGSLKGVLKNLFYFQSIFIGIIIMQTITKTSAAAKQLAKEAGDKIASLLNFGKSLKVGSSVNIKVLDEPIYFGTVPEFKNKVVVVYDNNNVDSLYGLAWFSNIYADQVIPVNWEDQDIPGAHTSAIFVVGVELGSDELLEINKNNPNAEIFIYSYKSSYDYLYDKEINKVFTNITLFRADEDFFIGGEGGIANFENTISSLIKIAYYYTYAWRNWELGNYCTVFAHYSSFFGSVKDYGLTKTNFKEEVIYSNNQQIMKRSVIDNSREALVYDFKNKAHSALIGNNLSVLAKIGVSSNKMEYNLYRDRLQKQVDKGGKVYALRDKRFIDAKVHNALFVPCSGNDFIEVIMYATRNYPTVVAVEECADFKTYFVYSTIKGHAKVFAELLHGDSIRNSINGTVIVKKAKHHNGEYNY